MRLLWQVSLCCLLATGIGMAQRGGGGGGMRGGGGGGGMRGGGGYGGGMRGGTGFVGGGVGGFRGGVTNFGGGFTGFRGGVGAFGFRGGFRNFDNRVGFNRGFFGYGGYWPFYYGGIGYWPGYYGYGYSSYFPGYDYYPYDSGYATYQPSPNVTVVYPPQTAPLSAERARPVSREYDQYGQEIRPTGSPLYLIAFTDHTIRAATTYRVDGNTLHYTTPEREDKEAPLNTVDRGLSMQLNRERQVPFQLPPQ